MYLAAMVARSEDGYRDWASSHGACFPKNPRFPKQKSTGSGFPFPSRFANRRASPPIVERIGGLSIARRGNGHPAYFIFFFREPAPRPADL